MVTWNSYTKEIYYSYCSLVWLQCFGSIYTFVSLTNLKSHLLITYGLLKILCINHFDIVRYHLHYYNFCCSALFFLGKTCLLVSILCDLCLFNISPCHMSVAMAFVHRVMSQCPRPASETVPHTTVWCCYNRAIFPNIFSTVTPQLAREGKLWGDCGEF